MMKLEMEKIANINNDSNKLFLMTHQSKKDFKSIEFLIDFLSYTKKELVLACKEHIIRNFKNLNSKENVIIEKISSDADALSLYKDKYMKTHAYVGLGNHSIGKSNLKGFNLKNCLIQSGVSDNDYSNFLNKNIKNIEGEIKEEKTPDQIKPNKNNPDKDKVSVIIGTFNRWDYLNEAIKSVKNQTYSNIEIIVINDGSTDQEYKNLQKPEDVLWIDLPSNSKNRHGFRCRSSTYNYGIKVASGNYIAFLDDDDAWYPDKLSMQISEMKRTKSKMSCTESFQGRGLFDINKEYKIYMGGINKRFKKWKIIEEDSSNIPKIWNKELLLTHNFCIGSSVIIEKTIFDKIGLLNESRRYKKGQDYELWKRVLSLTDCCFVNTPLVYYDHGHGKGRQY